MNSLSYSVGIYPTIQLLTYQPSQIRRILVHSKIRSNDGLTKIITLSESNSISIIKGADKLIRKIAQKDNEYVVGEFEPYEESIDSNRNHVVLAHPQNPGNLGTIIRAMVAFGYKDLAILLPATKIFDTKTVRASMGAVFQIKCTYFKSFDKYLKSFPARSLYAFTTDGTKELQEINPHTPFSLIFGNEATGLQDEICNASETVRIAQAESIDSLNLATSASIALHYYSETN